MSHSVGGLLCRRASAVYRNSLLAYVWALLTIAPGLFLQAGCVAVCAQREHLPVSDEVSSVTFNQRWLEGRWRETSQSSVSFLDQLSKYGTATEVVSRFGVSAAAVQFAEPESVLKFVLRSCPDMSVVYPSEQYFYYRFYLGETLVSGNLRFVDAPQQLWVGYFNQRYPNEYRARPFGRDDGLEIQQLAKPEGTVYTVVYDGIKKSFLIPSFWLQSTSGIPVRSSERLLTGTLDESGFGFGLIFDDASNSFKYVLNENAPLPEKLVSICIDGTEFRVGRESRFVFIRDEDRWMLVGVADDEVRANSYFDGPFDQIPPHVPLRDEIEKAYPYVKLAGGIDFNGNFLELSGQRVAISSYQQYSELPRLFCENATSVVKTMPGGLALLTWEAKRVFHLSQQQDPGSGAREPYLHDLAKSKSWPANHFSHRSQSQHQAVP